MSEESRVAVLVPTFKRANKLAALLENIQERTQMPHRVYFVLEREDVASIEAAHDLRAEIIFNEGRGSYASCINTGYRRTTEPFLILAADDVRFGRDAIAAALAMMVDDSIGILGALDPLHEDQDDHATHYLVRRAYIEEQGGTMDSKGCVLFDYGHAYTDVEAVHVAKVRNAYKFCPEFIVYHDHPGWVGGGAVDESSPLFDEVYKKGNAALADDLAVFALRSRRWRRKLLSRPDASSFDRKILSLAQANDPRTRAAIRARRLVRRLGSSARRRLQDMLSIEARSHPKD